MTARFVFKSSSLYLCVTAAEVAASLVTLPIMTRALTPADYGLMLLIANAAGFTNLLFGFSLAQALSTLFVNAPSPEQRRTVATSILVTIAVVSAVAYTTLAVVGVLLAQRLLGLQVPAELAWIAALALFLSAFSLCLATLVRLLERHTLFAAAQLPAVVVQFVILTLLLVALRWELRSLYVAVACASMFTTVVYLIALWHWLTGRFDLSVVERAVGVAANMVPWQFATLLTTSASGFFLAREGRLAEAGVFAVAASTVSFVVNFSNSFMNVWTPFVLTRHSEAGIAATQRRVFELFSAALLLVASGLSLFAQELFTLLLGRSFHAAFHYVPPLAFAFCIYCFANNFAQGLQAKQMTRAYVWIGVTVGSVFLMAALLLVRPFGAYGLIAAMAVGFSCMLVLLQIVSGRVMPVGYPWGRHGLMWATAVCIVAVGYDAAGGWQGLAVKGLAGLAILALPFLFRAVRAADVGATLATVAMLRPR